MGILLKYRQRETRPPQDHPPSRLATLRRIVASLPSVSPLPSSLSCDNLFTSRGGSLMAANKPPGWVRHVWVGLLGCVAAVVGVLLVMAALKPGQLSAAPDSMQPAAFLKTDKLLVTIGLINAEG